MSVMMAFDLNGHEAVEGAKGPRPSVTSLEGMMVG